MFAGDEFVKDEHGERYATESKKVGEQTTIEEARGFFCRRVCREAEMPQGLIELGKSSCEGRRVGVPIGTFL